MQAEEQQEAKEEALHDVARDWGSGVAASGPDAGRRYYVNYATGKTSFSAPAYVAQALSQLRRERKAEEKSKVERDAALYKEGFLVSHLLVGVQVFVCVRGGLCVCGGGVEQLCVYVREYESL